MVLDEPKTYVLAVSGGVDSVVLLDMMSRLPNAKLVVAHFDHGIRDDSADDARFVEGLARRYGVEFETKREELGAHASEDLARTRRYEFLRDVARRHQGWLVTAHHGDDVVETVAINLTRGTGWRGLAAMHSDVLRPLTGHSKRQLLLYALEHELEWQQDSTNASDVYLRNRMRRKISQLPRPIQKEVGQLRAKQIALKQQIDSEVQRLVGTGPSYERYFFIHVPAFVALECLRGATKARLTRPQLERALLAVKTSKAGSLYEAGSGVKLRFTSRQFTVELLK